jgi:hypothetical protein
VVTPATSFVRTGSCRGEAQRDVQCRDMRRLDMAYGSLGFVGAPGPDKRRRIRLMRRDEFSNRYLQLGDAAMSVKVKQRDEN